MYEVLLIVHIVAAMIWVGGGIYSLLEDSRVRQGGERLEMVLEHSDWTGTRVFGPAAVVTVLAGIGMVVSNNAWAFSHTWIWLAIVLFAVSLAIGAGFYGPIYARIRALNGEGGDAVALAAVRRRLAIVSRIDATLLIAIVILMVTKPGA
jgi:uncharacterized membrane protein